MRIYGIIGWKNAGKTTLTERLVAEITARGFSVSTVKHVHHDVDLDQPGKDTYRHRQAGAREVVLASPHRLALMREYHGAEPPLAEILARLAPVDLVLVEGYKRDAHPKVEVFRPANGRDLIQPGDPTVRAVASDADLPGLTVPRLDLNDVTAIADFILSDLDLPPRAAGSGTPVRDLAPGPLPSVGGSQTAGPAAASPPFRIRHGIPETCRDRAVGLYWQAFGTKLGRVMGPVPRAWAYLHRVMRLHSAFAALDGDGQLIGIAGYRTPQGTFAGGTLANLRDIYGRAGASWRATLLWQIAKGPEHGDFLIDGVCVDAGARGQGIGTALMDAICAEARAQGFAAARLEVVDTNVQARRLYERLGFVAIETQRIGVLRHVFGFAAATTMVRPLDG